MGFKVRQLCVDVEHLRAENERLREAISDALADLIPGVAPYHVLRDVLSSELCDALTQPHPKEK